MKNMIITIESEAYLEIVKKIDLITNYIKNNSPSVAEKTIRFEDVWLTTEEVLDLLRIGRRTLQRMRTNGEISYAFSHGKCFYRFCDIENIIKEKLISVEPQTIDELRKKYLRNVK